MDSDFNSQLLLSHGGSKLVKNATLFFLGLNATLLLCTDFTDKQVNIHFFSSKLTYAVFFKIQIYRSSFFLQITICSLHTNHIPCVIS